MLTALSNFSITWALARTPSRAPSRSTTCRRWAPCASQWRAISTGSSAYRFSREKSPCTSRTQRPPRMSTAGIGVNIAARRYPTEVRVDPQPQVGTLLRMKLGRLDVVLCDDRRELATIISDAERDPRIGRISIVPVDEIEVAALRDPIEQRMSALEVNVVPADLGHLQAVIGSEPSHGAWQNPETLDAATLLTAIKQQLQADTHAQK